MKRFLAQFINRHYKAFRTWILRTGNRPLILAFFFIFSTAEDIVLGRKRETRLDAHMRTLWKQLYFNRFGSAALYRVDTETPVALHSDDHKWPRGTVQDNSSNRRFNLKLYAMLGFRPELNLLDLGCAGGGFVRTVIEDGHTAIGIEGSDVSKKLRSREWDTCPHHLFTADITKPFQVMTVNNAALAFDVVTAWEVLEHVPDTALDGLIDNIRRHLLPGGYFFGSACLLPDDNPLTGAVYHVTLKPREWWVERFARFNLHPVASHNFETEDYVRGNATGLTEWDPRTGGGFHLILQYRP